MMLYPLCCIPVRTIFLGDFSQLNSTPIKCSSLLTESTPSQRGGRRQKQCLLVLLKRNLEQTYKTEKKETL